MSSILGLNLLYLLVENRLADFHCELELLSEAEKQLPTVVFCTRLDQHLVVGSYDQVLQAAANPPTQYFSFFLKSLLETVRINIGECAAAAYKSITIAAITEVLMFDREEETLEFMADFYPTWDVDAMQGVVTLSGSKGASKADEMPSLKLINQNLSYATELERIV
jgi:26S proteasome regulatory subunit N12